MKTKKLLATWLEKYAKVSIKERTYNLYKEIIRLHIDPILGDSHIKKISTDLIQNFILNKLLHGNLKNKNGLSSNSVLSIVSVLKQAFKFAILWGLINKNPTDNLKLPKIEEKEIYAFERFEQKKIENFCKDSNKDSYFGIIICLYTGIRLGELLALTWDDICFEKKLMYIRKTVYQSKKNNVIHSPKTPKSNRVIPLSNLLIEYLKKIRKKSKSIYLISTKNNGMVSCRSYQRTFEIILKKCKINHHSFHSLRHTFATRAIEVGMDVKTLSEILGHANPAITLQRYAHSMLNYKIKEMNRISELLR